MADKESNHSLLEQSLGDAGRRKMSRRDVLGFAAKGAVGIAALSGAGVIGYIWPRPKVKPSTVVKTVSRPRFHSRPDLDPMRVKVTHSGVVADTGYIYLTPSIVPGIRGVDESEAVRQGLGQEGVMIIDAAGEVIWFVPLGKFATNLRVQSYHGAPVLTYWQGDINAGIGSGVGVILDSSYQQIAIVHGGNGIEPDLHDFTITPQGTALVTAYQTKSADLSSVGGKRKDTVYDSMVQEVDIATGKVIFEWRSLDHVALGESYMKRNATPAYDYFHINSVSLDNDQNLLVSARNTWTLYKIDRTSGQVVWRLGGKKSDFKMGPGTAFAWQHHATRLAGPQISLFNDAATPPIASKSSAMILNVDETAMAVSLARAYSHPAELLAPYEGSAQMLPNGHMFVGWGAEPYFSEFDTSGALVLDGRFPTNDQSYRAFRMPWVGAPADRPAIATMKDTIGGITVFASWNGATQIRRWQVLAGENASALTPIGAVPKGGFETAISVHTNQKYVAAAALDSDGKRLGISKVVHV